MKAARVRQLDIAHLAGVSPSLVCKVIAREAPHSDTVERVWRALEDVLQKVS